MDFTGKCALVSGAASGMGYLFSEYFSKLGGELGCCMYLTVYEHDDFAHITQYHYSSKGGASTSDFHFH